MNKKVVVIGGGHGQATILRAIKNIKDIDISAIVTVADDGGSTGRLRKAFDIPALGDVRNVMVALAHSSKLKHLMSYRFPDDVEEIGGHSLGNLVLLALTLYTGNFMKAITELSDVLNVQGKILPSTTEIVSLSGLMDNGEVIVGESKIANSSGKIKKVFYDKEVQGQKEAINAILEADLILIGIGSLYTSVLPNLIIDDIKQAMQKTRAHKVYLCNVMSQKSETDNYFVQDYVEAIHLHLGSEIDEVVVANDVIPDNIMNAYIKEGAHRVLLDTKPLVCKVTKVELLDDFKHNLVRHSFKKLNSLICEMLGRL